MTLLLVFYLIGVIAYIWITTGMRLENARKHFPQPITGIKTILGGLIWPLMSIWLICSKYIFDSGAPKPIQDPRKVEYRDLYPRGDL